MSVAQFGGFSPVVVVVGAVFTTRDVLEDVVVGLACRLDMVGGGGGDGRRGKVDEAPYDFTFSGMKSAVLNYLNHAEMTGETVNPADVAASFQAAVVEVLVSRAMHAAGELGEKKLVLAGGVAANGALRKALKEACDEKGIRLYVPSPILCTDNAAMIGAAAYYRLRRGERSGWDLNAVPALEL